MGGGGGGWVLGHPLIYPTVGNNCEKKLLRPIISGGGSHKKGLRLFYILQELPQNTM